MNTMVSIPYVVGQWVRGDRFYGRAPLIEEVLEGHRSSIWLLGTRRIGKTSLLKQIEHIAETSENPRFFPVFWDFQGTGEPEELHLNFADALLDAEERLERIGLGLDDVTAEDLFVSLGRLRRQLRDRNLGLLLLCDEVEELIKLQQKDPSLLGKLRRAMQTREDTRSVIASTIRLWALADRQEDTSPFLHGFTPPLYIERLSDEEAWSLIRQERLDAHQRPRIPDEVTEAIREHCGNHPYLIQLVCKRYFETGRLLDAIEQVGTDRMVSYFFSVDFEMLSDQEADIVRFIASSTGVQSHSIQEALAIGADSAKGSLHRLENLGFISRNRDQRFILANRFFSRWMREVQSQPTPGLSAPEPAGEIVSQHRDRGKETVPSTGGLFAELKRRKVVRVGIAYIALSWALLQVADVAFEFLEVPSWAGKFLIVMLAVGLPVALFLAWAFELTPQGIVREENARREKAAGHSPRRGTNRSPDRQVGLADEPELPMLPMDTSGMPDAEQGARGATLIDELERLMVEEKIYREENFTIRRLAEALNIKEYRLRRLINTNLGYRNFNQFLNQYRIEEVARLLVDPDTRHLPVLSIALDMGYRSLSPFNKAFREIKGMTPTEYRSRYAPRLPDPCTAQPRNSG
jgi:AraC-like DNA-binding protein